MDGWVSGWVDGALSTACCLGKTREEKGLSNENTKKIQRGYNSSISLGARSA